MQKLVEKVVGKLLSSLETCQKKLNCKVHDGRHGHDTLGCHEWEAMTGVMVMTTVPVMVLTLDFFRLCILVMTTLPFPRHDGRHAGKKGVMIV